MQTLTVADFKPGDHVRYVPFHANGDRSHPDCEDGVVTSTNEKFVFVRYHPLASHGVPTEPGDLCKL